MPSVFLTVNIFTSVKGFISVLFTLFVFSFFSFFLNPLCLSVHTFIFAHVCNASDAVNSFTWMCLSTLMKEHKKDLLTLKM